MGNSPLCFIFAKLLLEPKWIKPVKCEFPCVYSGSCRVQFSKAVNATSKIYNEQIYPIVHDIACHTGEIAEQGVGLLVTSGSGFQFCVKLLTNDLNYRLCTSHITIHICC